MKNRSWFWGLFFIAGAGVLLLSALGSPLGISLWDLLLTLVFVAILLQSLPRGEWFGIIMPIAFLYMIYDKYLPAPFSDISAWYVLLIAAFLATGLSILFKKKRVFHVNIGGDKSFSSSSGENLTGSEVYSDLSFGDAVKYIYSDNLEKGDFDCSFGTMKIYFDQATLKDNRATVHVDCSFGAVELYIPREWNVVNNVSSSFGHNSDSTKYRQDNEITLYLEGDVSFGEIKIITI